MKRTAPLDPASGPTRSPNAGRSRHRSATRRVTVVRVAGSISSVNASRRTVRCSPSAGTGSRQSRSRSCCWQVAARSRSAALSNVRNQWKLRRPGVQPGRSQWSVIEDRTRKRSQSSWTGSCSLTAARRGPVPGTPRPVRRRRAGSARVRCVRRGRTHGPRPPARRRGHRCGHLPTVRPGELGQRSRRHRCGWRTRPTKRERILNRPPTAGEMLGSVVPRPPVRSVRPSAGRYAGRNRDGPAGG